MGWDLEKVERYAGPPLAERSYIADRAQSVEVRSGVTLATSSQTVLEADGVDPDSVEWDSWRREDSKWVVSVTYARGAGNAGGVNAELPATWAADRTRPLCPFPQVARYKGAGDIEKAESFVCK